MVFLTRVVPGDARSGSVCHALLKGPLRHPGARKVQTSGLSLTRGSRPCESPDALTSVLLIGAQSRSRCEPDLKDGRGGLRDVHALGWADAARLILFPADRDSLASAYATVLADSRRAPAQYRRAGNQLTLQEQDAVAAAVGDRDADALMARLAAAARTIAWTSDDTWARIQSSLGRAARPAGSPRPRGRPWVGVAGRRDPRRGRGFARRRSHPRGAGGGRDGQVSDRHRPAFARTAGRPRLARCPSRGPGRRGRHWSTCCSTGEPAIGVIEALDQRGPMGQDPARVACRCGAGRSATPITGSRSTVIWSRPPPARPRWPTAFAGPTSSCWGRSCTTWARAQPGDHSVTGADLADARSALGWVSPNPTSTCSYGWSATTCCFRRWQRDATSTTRRPSRSWRPPSGPSRCSSSWPP